MNVARSPSVQVAGWQANNGDGDCPNPLHYLRVPVGESFSPRELHRAMESRGIFPCAPLDQNAFHLDLGHVPPPDCNTLLFQLLLEGCVRQDYSWGVVERY